MIISLCENNKSTFPIDSPIHVLVLSWYPWQLFITLLYPCHSLLLNLTPTDSIFRCTWECEHKSVSLLLHLSTQKIKQLHAGIVQDFHCSACGDQEKHALCLVPQIRCQCSALSSNIAQLNELAKSDHGDRGCCNKRQISKDSKAFRIMPHFFHNRSLNRHLPWDEFDKRCSCMFNCTETCRNATWAHRAQTPRHWKDRNLNNEISPHNLTVKRLRLASFNPPSSPWCNVILLHPPGVRRTCRIEGREKRS